ncbi:MAG: PmoA family protein [Candidatus Omnitrophica bacterium]|nr:PmoA family protein [Candidatus Omnitrophota bacterium]MCB9784870.1 PmoA family protein [Candidatus Omnitrophota bacterium]
MSDTPVFSIAFALILIHSLISSPQALQIQNEKDVISISSNGQTLLQYKFDEVPYKPYVKEFYTPSGINILRDAPHDHLHHHALMYAISVDGVNFWEEFQAPGQEKHVGFEEMRHGEDGAGFVEKLDWMNPRTDEVLIQETRTLTAYSEENSDASLITWQTEFSLPEGKEQATLTGSKYFGLGMRFLTSMDTGGRFFNADGGVGVEATDDKNSKWCAYTAKADGKPVTIAVFDDPKNPRSPANWYTMDDPFAYLTATLALDTEPLVMKENLLLRYGVALWDGEASSDEVEALYQKWLRLLKD